MGSDIEPAELRVTEAANGRWTAYAQNYWWGAAVGDTPDEALDNLIIKVKPEHPGLADWIARGRKRRRVIEYQVLR